MLNDLVCRATRSRRRAASAGRMVSIKEDAIQLRVPPDNIKLEVVKSSIASVTTDEAPK